MKRVPVIDLVRFFAFFVVIGGHFYPPWVVQSLPVFFRGLVLQTFLNGAYGVICFFTVSGFLITGMLAGKEEDLSRIDLGSFYVRRVARILPLFLLVVFMGWVLEQQVGHLLAPVRDRYDAWRGAGHFGPWFWVSLFTFNFNWYEIFHGDEMGLHWQVLWSLAVEEQFYLVYPFILKNLGNRRRAVLFLGGVIGAGFLYRYWAWSQFSENRWLISRGSFGCFDQLAVGALAYFFLERFGGWLAKKPLLAGTMMVLGFSGVGGIFLATAFDDPAQYEWVPTILALCCALIFVGGIVMVFWKNQVVQVLSWPGKLSYGCYLWHGSLITLFMPVLVTLRGLEASVYLMVSVVFFSWLSYRFYEVPMNRRIRRWFGLVPSATE